MKRTEEKQGTLRWDKLDNTAHVFPVIAGNEMTNVYRISVVLKEEVQQDLLQQALDIVLPKFEIFHVRLRQGIFWYYFEENVKRAPRVHEEETYPCRYIVQNKNRSYLFRVTYYKKRINLEVFHVLTDGMGGINFLREVSPRLAVIIRSFTEKSMPLRSKYFLLKRISFPKKNTISGYSIPHFKDSNQKWSRCPWLEKI